jgi:protein-tyrosine phosphatase
MKNRGIGHAARWAFCVSLALAMGAVAVQAQRQTGKDAPGQSLGIASVANLRDLGGYTTCDGLVVRTKLLYRSNQLGHITPDDLEKIARLGLSNVYDLRTAEERAALPDELPPGVNDTWLDVLGQGPQMAPAQVDKLMENPKEANAVLGAGKAEALMVQAYRDFVSLPSARKAFRRLFSEIARPDNLPALFHCTTGKDRTGWAAAALLSLLGVPQQTILEDFLRSNDYILPAYQKQIDAFVAAGGDPAIPSAILGVRSQYLKAALGEMRTRYGTIEGYFTKALEIDAAGQKALRDLYLARQ